MLNSDQHQRGTGIWSKCQYVSMFSKKKSDITRFHPDVYNPNKKSIGTGAKLSDYK